MESELLSELQRDFPLTDRPFLEISKRLNRSEDEVLELVRDLKKRSVIRQISAIFDTKSLGYSSSLVAFKVDEKEIDSAVEVINSHPGVSHNYERDHDFNIWFTIAVEADSRFGLEKSVEILAKRSNAKEYIILPTLKMFKISVKLDTTGKAAKKERVERAKKEQIKLTPLHKRVINLSQNDIDIVSEPFKETVERLGIGYSEFFNLLDELKRAGVMRRFAAILNHRKAGFSANAMTVWDVDEEKGEEIGKKAAAFSAVSHCYLRPKFKNWNYNLFTMIHAKTKEQIDSIIKDMESEIEFRDRRLLYSTREFKKVRLKYFGDEFKKWEESIIA
jgi:DNA-binding Lrp family transcriptional regulator